MILADTSGVVAAIVPQDLYHDAVRRWLRENTAEVALPTPCLGEIGYFAGRLLPPSSESAFVRRLVRGPFAPIEPHDIDYLRAAELVERYADFPIGIVDALIVAMAERLQVTTILTLDRRHFGAIKPLHCESFTLVP